MQNVHLLYPAELSHNMTIVSELKQELTIIFLKYVPNRSLTFLKSILRHNLFKICTTSKKYSTPKTMITSNIRNFRFRNPE